MTSASMDLIAGPWDVIVVGGGNAALCASIEAAEAGARVLLLESAPKPYRGGNSRHTRNFRCMHRGPLSVLSDSYEESEYLDDLLRVTKGETDEALAPPAACAVAAAAVEATDAAALLPPDTQWRDKRTTANPRAF